VVGRHIDNVGDDQNQEVAARLTRRSYPESEGMDCRVEMNAEVYTRLLPTRGVVRTINRPINRSTFCSNNVRTIIELFEQWTFTKIT
jgi:hypothetical protein